MVIRMVNVEKRDSFWVVITVAKKGQFRVVSTVVKKEQCFGGYSGG